MTKAYRHFSYCRSRDQSTEVARHPVVIVGAGPVGLALAVDLAQRGLRPVLIDDNDRIGNGSRAICFAKRTLEVFDRLGIGSACIAKGVQWRKGRVFHRNAQLYDFDLLPEPGHKMPAFINLQQYYVEGYLVDRALAHGAVDLRWKHRLVGLEQRADGARLTIDTPDGPYALDADWVVACDGARSPTRGMLNLAFDGEQFEDQFLIADVKMSAAFPTERWFWFEPPFHAGQSALLHKQPDDVWRIDLQLSPVADANHEQRPDVVIPRIEKMLGHTNFELEWVSVYRFQCRRIARFVHDRVIFAGDAAHQVSPFGARGANSGVQDVDNLGWKLAKVVRGESPASLIESYHVERSAAADENILHSTRSTDFIAPRGAAERQLRDAALALAPDAEFAKRLINSGRLSTAAAYRDSPLSTPDQDLWSGGPPPGASMVDAPLRSQGADIYLSDAVDARFHILSFAADAIVLQAVELRPGGNVPTQPRQLEDPTGLLADRYDTLSGGTYLLRPDGHIAGRWKAPTQRMLADAVLLAEGKS